MYTRNQYLNNECTHREYYGQFVNAETKRVVKQRIGLDRIMASKNDSLNDIHLSEWDGFNRFLPLDKAFSEVGDNASLSGYVCVAKEAAKQLIEEHQG